ncbi:MAG: host-nuclease inhibitor Gam family protein [Methylicorpusculum sp.]|uniref:host-nuclease inhibitor Gam family protein n=1 Tax=Methylicorpusculum sp. TaxID=2713644 RepID=UPI0027173373|nr:host-nuclease inhibitor Gam family protein [Methylicorpusculum sp.]MDO8940868.1 host-nuclease inhibitor Gam family protein [Methylicorpusculum sp.]MDP2202440.1 host-nuclease inhibitor Gam family protein [Methylicorpusculum sp.]
MSTAKRTRIKQAAQLAVPQNKDECAEYINQIGRCDRQIAVLQAAMNDEIAVITDRYTGEFTPLQEQIKALSEGVQSWCEANRDELTVNGKTKSGQFLTGTVQWRQKPPSVAVRGVEAVLETLKRLGLSRFVRTKEELNKEAILNEPAAVKGVAGLSIKTGVEDFVISPFEQEA